MGLQLLAVIVGIYLQREAVPLSIPYFVQRVQQNPGAGR